MRLQQSHELNAKCLVLAVVSGYKCSTPWICCRVSTILRGHVTLATPPLILF